VQVGDVDPYGGRIVRISDSGSLVIWYYPNSDRYGIYLYKEPIQAWDDEWLLYSQRAQRERAELIFETVLKLLA
jgi:hypothetical protein